MTGNEVAGPPDPRMVDAHMEPEDHATTDFIAQSFHDTYEALAPSFGYKTRSASAVAWRNIPEANRALMVATCTELLRMGVIALPRRSDPAAITQQLVDDARAGRSIN